MKKAREIKWHEGTLVALLLVVAVGCAFEAGLYGDFLNWDDQQNFVKNTLFRGLASQNVRWALTTMHLGVYQPLAWLLFSLEYTLFGLDAFAFHCVSFALHLINAVLLFMLLVRLITPPVDASNANEASCVPGAGLAAALIMAHPQRTEVVAWLSCQPYLAAVFCALLSLHAYLGAREATRYRRVWFALAMLAYAASLLCKTIFIGLPLVLLLIDYHGWRNMARRSYGSLWRHLYLKMPFLLLAILFASVGVFARNTASWEDIGLFARMHQILYRMGFFWEKTFIPLGLTSYYPADPVPPLLLSRIMVGLSSLTILGLVFALRNKAALFGLLTLVGGAALVAMAPNLGIVMTGHVAAADRYTYLPALAIALLPAGLLIRLQRPVVRRFMLLAGMMVVAMFIVLSRRQCLIWHDSVALWSHADQLADHTSSEISYNLALALEQRGRRLEAEKSYLDALRNDPGCSQAHFNLALLLAKQQRFAEARLHFGQAAALVPSDPDAFEGYANALMAERRFAEAVTAYGEVLQLNPSALRARHSLAKALIAVDRRREALMQLDYILKEVPSSGAVAALKQALLHGTAESVGAESSH